VTTSVTKIECLAVFGIAMFAFLPRVIRYPRAGVLERSTQWHKTHCDLSHGAVCQTRIKPYRTMSDARRRDRRRFLL